MKQCVLSQVCEINPARIIPLPENTPISFVPMGSVSTNGHVDLDKTVDRSLAGNYTVFRNGDIIFAKITPCMENGKMAIVDNLLNGYGAGSTEFIVLRPNRDVVTAQWLYLFLSQPRFRLQCQQHMTGSAGQKRVPPKYLASCPIPVPSLAEQKRIVAKIEELFSELDSGVETLKTTKQQLAVYRQAVYASVYEENNMRPITAFFEISSGLTKNSKRNELPIQRPYLRVANVYYNELDLSEIKWIGVNDKEIQKTTLRKDDLLFVEGNGSKEQIGRVAIWDGSIDECLHQNHLIKGRPLGTMIPQYALYYLISAYGRKQIFEVASSTSGLYTLSSNKVRNLKIPFLDIEKQKRCVSLVKQRLSVCDSFEKTVDAALQQAEAMRQSILKKAFEGGF